MSRGPSLFFPDDYMLVLKGNRQKKKKKKTCWGWRGPPKKHTHIHICIYIYIHRQVENGRLWASTPWVGFGPRKQILDSLT